jgi:hypothetical protein
VYPGTVELKFSKIKSFRLPPEAVMYGSNEVAESVEKEEEEPRNFATASPTSARKDVSEHDTLALLDLNPVKSDESFGGDGSDLVGSTSCCPSSAASLLFLPFMYIDRP